MLFKTKQGGFIPKRMAYQSLNPNAELEEGKEQQSETERLDQLQASLEDAGAKRAELSRETSESLQPIQAVYQKYLETTANLKGEFAQKQSAVFQDLEFYGQKVTVVLEKISGKEGISETTYLNFVDLNQRGREINLLDWAKDRAAELNK